jgi:hypothetical protein
MTSLPQEPLERRAWPRYTPTDHWLDPCLIRVFGGFSLENPWHSRTICSAGPFGLTLGTRTRIIVILTIFFQNNLPQDFLVEEVDDVTTDVHVKMVRLQHCHNLEENLRFLKLWWLLRFDPVECLVSSCC